jgi:hypothetical protein
MKQINLRIPKKIKILTSEYKIKINPKGKVLNNGKELSGLCNFEKKEIFLEQDFELLSLYHEISHAILWETKLADKSNEVYAHLLGRVLEQLSKEIYVWCGQQKIKR